MSIRKRNDSDGYRRGAVGIDDDKGGRFTKENRTDPWTVEPRGVSYVPGDGVRRKDTVKPGAGIDGDEGVGILRNKPEGAGTGGTRDIYSDVDRNSDNASETGGTGPIRYGTDK